jgi:hypothetical protein
MWLILKTPRARPALRFSRHQRHDRRWRRYEKASPGHRVQIDALERLPFQGEVIQTAKGAEFQAAFHLAWTKASNTRQHQTPRPMPEREVERSHRIDAEGYPLLDGISRIPSAA